MPARLSKAKELRARYTCTGTIERARWEEHKRRGAKELRASGSTLWVDDRCIPWMWE